MSLLQQSFAGRLTMLAELWPSRAQFDSLPVATRWTMLCLLGWCLMVGAAVMAAIITIQLIASGRTVPTAVAVPAAEQSTIAGDAILERPLFARSRQVAIAAPVRVAAVPPPPPPVIAASDTGVRLSGVFINGGTAKAFVTTAQNPSGVWLSPGETMGEWRLVAVRPGEAEMQGGRGRLILPFAASAPGK